MLLRVVQGLSLGGEWGGSILLATEHSGAVKRAFYAAIPQLGSPVGSILSAALFIVMTIALPAEELAAWGWRIPFLIAFPLLLVSLYLRWSIDETPVFREVVAEGRRDRLPFATMFRQRPVAIVIAIGAALLGIGSYSLMNTYTINYGAAELGFSFQDLLIATTIGGLLQLVTIPLFGSWATRIGSARVVAWGALGTLLITFPMYFLLQFATFPILVGTMIIGGILPDDVVGGARRADERPLPRPLPLLGAVDLLRDRGDRRRVRPARHARARRGDRLRVVAPRRRARAALGRHARVGLGGLAHAAGARGRRPRRRRDARARLRRVSAPPRRSASVTTHRSPPVSGGLRSSPVGWIVAHSGTSVLTQCRRYRTGAS